MARCFSTLLLVLLLDGQKPRGVQGWELSPQGRSGLLSPLGEEGRAAKSLAGFYKAAGLTGHELEEGEKLAALKAEEAAGSEKKTKAEKECGPECRFLLGCLLWCFAPVLLWNNERIAIKQYKMQLKASRWALHVGDVEKVPREEMEGHIVYMQGKSTCDETLADEKFPAVKGDQIIKLRREVQMYQWVEVEHEDDNGKKTYSYHQAWRDGPEDTPHAGSMKKNPPFRLQSSVRDHTFYRHWSNQRSGACSRDKTDGRLQAKCAQAPSAKVRMGAYYLGDYVTRQLRNWSPMKGLTKEQLRSCTVPEVQMLIATQAGDDALEERSDGWWYLGKQQGSGAPRTGDLRVRFEELKCGPLSLCGVLAKTETGYTLVPVIRHDSGGVGEGFCAEIGGGNCCYRPKTITYGGKEEYPKDEKEFDKLLQDRPREFEESERKSFRRSRTTAQNAEYDPDDVNDLCCAGCFGGLFIKLIHWMGLEEEFLAAQEKKLSFDSLMALEGREASGRHHAARFIGLIFLLLGSFLILEPALKVLNAHWLISLLGGALVSGGLLLIGCLCSCGCWISIMSIAWIAYRPQLALVALILVAGVWFAVTDEELMASMRKMFVPDAADKAVADAAGCPNGDCGAKEFLQIGLAQLRKKPWGF